MKLQWDKKHSEKLKSCHESKWNLAINSQNVVLLCARGLQKTFSQLKFHFLFQWQKMILQWDKKHFERLKSMWNHMILILTIKCGIIVGKNLKTVMTLFDSTS